MTPVAIGDIQRTQGTLKTVCKAKNRYRHLLLCLHPGADPEFSLNMATKFNGGADHIYSFKFLNSCLPYRKFGPVDGLPLDLVSVNTHPPHQTVKDQGPPLCSYVWERWSSKYVPNFPQNSSSEPGTSHLLIYIKEVED